MGCLAEWMIYRPERGAGRCKGSTRFDLVQVVILFRWSERTSLRLGSGAKGRRLDISVQRGQGGHAPPSASFSSFASCSWSSPLGCLNLLLESLVATTEAQINERHVRRRGGEGRGGDGGRESTRVLGPTLTPSDTYPFTHHPPKDPSLHGCLDGQEWVAIITTLPVPDIEGRDPAEQSRWSFPRACAVLASRINASLSHSLSYSFIHSPSRSNHMGHLRTHSPAAAWTGNTEAVGMLRK